MDAEIVQESAIFAALAPAGTASALRAQVPSEQEITTLPMMPQGRRLFSPKTPRGLMTSFPITAQECAIVWKYLSDWVQTQIAMEAPAAIPGFGVVALKTRAMQIRMPVFEPERAFLDKFGLQMADSGSLSMVSQRANTQAPSQAKADKARQATSAPNVFAFSYLEMASCCGSSVDAIRAQEWLQVVIQKLGQGMNQCKRVELNIGVGIISCDHRIVDHHMLSRYSNSAPPLFQYEIRTGESVVKRKLLALSQPSSSPKPKASFLTSKGFSQVIQLHPAFEQVNNAPNFDFEVSQSPRPPTIQYHGDSKYRRSPQFVHNPTITASPRSQQLQARLKGSTTSTSSDTTIVEKPCLPTPEKGNASLAYSTDSKDDFPEVFDSLGRTLCVEPCTDTTLLLPTNRIGSNFTVSAKRLMIVKSSNSALANGIVFVDEEIAPYEQKNVFGKFDISSTSNPVVLKRKFEAMSHPHEQFGVEPKVFGLDGLQAQNGDAGDSRSEQRYFSYLKDERQLIDRKWLSPLSPKLTDRIVSSAVKYLSESPSGSIRNILDEVQLEFTSNYYMSLKKAVLDYILLREESRQRLGITRGVPAYVKLPERWRWGDGNGMNGCFADLKALATRSVHPRSITHGITTRDEHNRLVNNKRNRQGRVRSKLNALLMCSDPHVRALQNIWAELESSVLLVNLPSVDELSHSMVPLDIFAFERKQLNHASTVKTRLMDIWYQKAKQVFEDATKGQSRLSVSTDTRLKHLFDVVGVLMSLQVRSLILRSIQAYVDFFELFTVNTTDSSSVDFKLADVQKHSSYSGLLISMILRGGEVQFVNSLIDIPSHLLSVLQNLPQLFHNINRIETQFEEQLIFARPSAPFLWNVTANEDALVLATIRIREIVECNIAQLQQLQLQYDRFAHVYRTISSADHHKLEDMCDLPVCHNELANVRATATKMISETSSMVLLRLFCVDCRLINTMLLDSLAQWSVRMLFAFQECTSRLNADLRNQYKDVAARLAKKPADLYELVDAEVFVHSLKATKLNELQERADDIKQRIRFLLFERPSIQVDESDDSSVVDTSPESISRSQSPTLATSDLLASTAKTIKWRGHIDKLLQNAEASLVNERARIEMIFTQKRTRFLAEIEEFDSEVKTFSKKGDLRHAATYVVQLAKMKDALLAFRKSMESIVEEEAKLKWKPTDFGKLDDIAEEMDPYEQLWKTVREFREMNSRWLRSNIYELQATDGIRTIQQMLSIISNVSKLLQLNCAAAAITADLVKKQMTDFRENIRLVAAILNPSMKERHLKEISTLVSLTLDPQEPVTLLKLLENGAFDHLQRVVEISANATQEKHVENILQDIDAEWKEVQFTFKSPENNALQPGNRKPTSATNDSSSLSLPSRLEESVMALRIAKASVENIKMLIDDHQQRLQTLLCMQHAIPFTHEITIWQQFMTNVLFVADQATLNQRLWKSLRPYFAANIVENGSKEAKSFELADQLHRSILNTIRHQPVCAELIPRIQRASADTTKAASFDLLTDLKACYSLLEETRECLRVGLESKRAAFPRFFVLSDRELVSVLASHFPSSSLPADSQIFWSSFSRCFPGVHHANVNAAKEITALVSHAGEQLSVGAPIDTANASMSIWLNKLESSMITMLQACVRAAVNDLARKEFRKWCLLWPEQVIHASIRCTWTMQSEFAFSKSSAAEIRRAWNALVGDLQEKITALSKEIKAATHPYLTVSLGNIIMLLSYLRDVSAQVHDDVVRSSAENEFQPHWQSLSWLAQPRFYYDDNTLNVKVMTSYSLPYGFEYLGNVSSGILLTPLTLRCFQSVVLGASTVGKGSCLEGNACTGKVTIYQALSRLCARLFVSYQCGNSPSIDSLTSFLKGTVSSAAWLCMENFHLLDAVIVSTITRLCAQLMDHLLAKQSQCTFLGSRLRLKKGAYFAITLPLEVSRTKESLLVQEARFFFRRIVVQTPDFEKLGELYLEQGKFSDPAAHAKLIYVVLSAFQRGYKLICHGVEQDMSYDQQSLLSSISIRKIVARAIELKLRDQIVQRIYYETDADDSIADHKEVRGTSKTEHLNVCVALLEFLSGRVSTSSLDLVEFLLRDFAANRLVRHLHLTNSFIFRPLKGIPQISHSMGSESNATFEDSVEEIVRVSDPSWTIFGVAFSQKTIHLLHAIQSNRLAIIAGDSLCGKTSLYKGLARALTQIHETEAGKIYPVGADRPDFELASAVRCVVIPPRALTLDVLWGLSANHHADTVLAKLIREARNFYDVDRKTHTWIILDGNLDLQWAEQLLYTVTETQDDTPDHDRGLLLKTRKRFTLPLYVRWVIESTSLANISPSFLTRTSIVNVGQSKSEIAWRGLYQTWKRRHEEEFDLLLEDISRITDMLVDETLDACLEFVHSNFHTGFHQTRHHRVCTLLSLYHSSLKRSWAKLVSMAGLKQRRTALHCFFLQALVWGIGGTSDALERQKFHIFLRHLVINGPRSSDSSLKRVIILFFPSSGVENSTSANLIEKASISSSNNGSTNTNRLLMSQSAGAVVKETIYSFAFSIEFGLKWMPWGEYYEHWLQSHANTSSSIVKHGQEHDGVEETVLTHFTTPTPNMAAALCLATQLMSADYAVVLSGPRDSGRTTTGKLLLQLHGFMSGALGVESSSLISSTGDVQPHHILNSAESGRLYMGSLTSATSLFKQLSPFIERVRWPFLPRRPRTPTNLLDSANQDIHQQNVLLSEEPEPKPMKYIFIDDLHCADDTRVMDSPIELCRYVVEQRQVVDLTSSLLVPCLNLLPFASVECPTIRNSNAKQDLTRLRAKFVPISLVALSDHDLLSICTVIATQSSDNSALASPEITQLLTTIVTTSIRLFRILATEIRIATKAGFLSSKVHYMPHARELFTLIKSVCCDARPTLLFSEKPLLARLWCHESARVFGDKFITTRDSTLFYQNVRDIALKSFSLAPDAFLPAHVDNLSRDATKNSAQVVSWLSDQFHFTFVGESSGAGFLDGYREVNDMQKVELSIERSMMAMYRANVATESIELVLCGYVIQHILRISRLLRHDGAHALLLGSQGKKTITITRLAAFICKKTAIVYYAGHQDSATPPGVDEVPSWKQAFKNAVLQSVRQPDTKIVFVFKDIHFSDMKYYGLLDQFLSGVNLPSDVISYEDFDEQIIKSLHSDAIRGSVSARTGLQHQQQSLNSKSAILSQFYASVRSNFQLVIALAPTQYDRSPIESSVIAQLVWSFPRIVKSCAVCYFMEWPEESLSTMAQKALSSLVLADKQRLAQLAQVSVLTYQSTRRFVERHCIKQQYIEDEESLAPPTATDAEDKAIKNVRFPWNDRPSSHLHLDPSMLLDQIGLFVLHFDRLENEIATTKARYEAGLAFMEKTEDLLAAEQSQAEILQPEMRRKTEFTRRMSGKMEKEKLTSNKLSKGYEFATTLIEAQRQRVIHLQNEYQGLIYDSMKAFMDKRQVMRVFQEAMREIYPGVSAQNDDVFADRDDTLAKESQESTQADPKSYNDDDPDAAVRRYRRALIKNFVSLKHVPTSLRQLAECLGLIFGIQPVQIRDELDADEIIMDYWESTTVRMRTALFWDELVSFDVAARVDGNVVAKLLPICTSPDFSEEMFSGVHELAGILCDWVQACALFARDLVLAEPKLTQLVNEREAFVEAQNQINARKLEIQEQVNTTTETNVQRHVSELERQELEGKLQENATALQMTASVWKVLASSSDKWKKLHEFYTELSVQWMGDLMIATSVIAYTSSMSSRARAELRKIWSDALGKHFLLHSPNRPIHQAFNLQNLSLMKWQMDGLPSHDMHSLENAVIATKSYLFPVMIDPSGMAGDWIRRHEAGNAVRVLSSRTATETAMWDEVLKCVKKKSTLVLLDFGESQAATLYSFIMSKRRGRFDLVNRDISNITNSSSGVNGSSLPRTGLNGINQHRCWFESRHEQIHEHKATYANAHHEFGSDCCRIYFVYSEGDSLEPWMARYMSQLCFVRFGLSTEHIRSKTMQKIAELQNNAQVFTEIQALTLDTISCEEQLEALESEILDILCAETPEAMFSDTSKALKIVGNRSAYNNIENSKHESKAKIQLHLDHLEQYRDLVQRCLDAVWIAQDVSFALREHHFLGESFLRAPLHWLWTVLARSLEGCGPNDPAEELTRKFTEAMIQYVTAGLSESDQALYELLFALRLYQRRNTTQIHMCVENAPMVINAGGNPIDVFFRLLLVLQCHNENQLKTLCASVLSKLLSLRPECVPIKIWRSICFLAEKSTELRQFIVYTTDKASSSKGTWKDLIEMNGKDPSCVWQPMQSLNPLVQLCLVSVVNKHLFKCESKSFVWSELFSASTLIESTSIAVKDSKYAATYFNAIQLSQTRFISSSSLDALWRRFSSHRTPIVVLCTSGMDFSHQVDEMARKAQVTINFACNEETKDDVFEQNMVTAVQKGHWVVLPNMHLSPHRLRLLRNIYEMIDGIKPHLDFRVWISVMKPQRVNASKRCIRSGDEAVVSQFALHKKFGSPMSFQSNLYNALTVIAEEKKCQGLASNYEKLVVRVAIFHAMVSSCDLFAFARWKAFEEGCFSDLELRTTITCVSSLWASLNQAADVWTAVHEAIANIYGSKVETYHEKLLISCCFDLLFPDTSANNSHQMDVLNAAQRAIPEVISAIHVLDNAGLVLALESKCAVWSNRNVAPKGTVWDFQLQHQQRQFANRLMNVFVNTAAVVPGAYMKMPPIASKSLSMASVVELLDKFRSELDAFSFDPNAIATKFPKTYKKPLNELIRYGIMQVDATRVELLCFVQQLFAVCTGTLAMEAEAWHQINAIASNTTPVQWVRLSGGDGRSIERGPEYFLRDILDRVKFFASCAEHEMPSRIPIDKFQHSEYVLEAIHQHFVRNHVGNTLCEPNCLRVVAIYEDRMQLTLPTKDDSLYIHGLRVKGHLQQDIVMTRVGGSSNSNNASSERRKSVGRAGYEAEILPQGIPVVLEVTSACLSPNLLELAKSLRSLPNVVTGPDRNSNAAPLTDTEPIIEYLCPIYRGGGEQDYHRSRPKTSIYVVSSLPLSQLVFSGSSLHIDSISDSPIMDA